jgi:hypothetical protein
VALETISRALAYVPYADVICYYSSIIDLSEAERFAFSMSALSPGKKLGVGFSAPDHQGIAREHANQARNLRKIGYDYLFIAQLGSIVFPGFPQGTPWGFFDDGAEVAASFECGSDDATGLTASVRSRVIQAVR